MPHQSWNFSLSLSSRFTGPITDQTFLLRLLPVSSAKQKIISAALEVSPQARLICTTDGFGNRLCSGLIAKAHDSFACQACGQVYFGDGDLYDPDPKRLYFCPSPQTTLSPEITDFAEDIELKPALSPWEKALRLAEIVHETLSYCQGKTNVQSSAAEAFSKRCGVCQDYTHLLLALCRHFKIGARYLSCLLEGEGPSHAAAEIYDGRAWRGLDPTYLKELDAKTLIIARGCEARDCALNCGVYKGFFTEEQRLSCRLVKD